MTQNPLVKSCSNINAFRYKLSIYSSGLLTIHTDIYSIMFLFENYLIQKYIHQEL